MRKNFRIVIALTVGFAMGQSQIPALAQFSDTVAIAASPAAGNAGTVTAVTDALQDVEWCSLPKSSVEDFVRRHSAAAGTKKSQAAHDRSRDERALAQLSAVSASFGEDRGIRDALVKGRLTINKPDGGVLTGAVTYEITRSGEEKITTDFGGVTSLSIHHAGKTTMRFGHRIIPLSPTTMEDHQILVFPQWSILHHAAEDVYGAKAYGLAYGFQTVEVSPPQRQRPVEETLLPSTPTCVAYDPETHLIARIERITRAENQPTSEHRQSIVYSNYQVIDGIPVPMKQVRYHDGIMRDTLTIDSVQFDKNFSAEEFTWPR